LFPDYLPFILHGALVGAGSLWPPNPTNANAWMDGLVVSRLLQKSGRFTQYYFNTKNLKIGKKNLKKDIKALNH
jgi:hypothetical protein